MNLEQYGEWKRALRDFQEQEILPNAVYVQLNNAKNSPSVRFFVVDQDDNNILYFIDKEETLDTNGQHIYKGERGMVTGDNYKNRTVAGSLTADGTFLCVKGFGERVGYKADEMGIMADPFKKVSKAIEMFFKCRSKKQPFAIKDFVNLEKRINQDLLLAWIKPANIKLASKEEEKAPSVQMQGKYVDFKIGAKKEVNAKPLMDVMNAIADKKPVDLAPNVNVNPLIRAMERYSKGR